MTKKGSKSVKKNAWKRVSVDEAKVANVDYNFYDVGYNGYVENDGALVYVDVIGVYFDLRKQIVKSVLRDANGNTYNREGSYLMYASPKHYEDNTHKEKTVYNTRTVLRIADVKTRECEYIVTDVNEEKGTSNIYLEVWIFEDGKAENVPVEINAVARTAGSCWTLADGSLPEHFWRSREEAYYYNEYEVIDDDGEKFTERGIGMRLMLTKEQQAAINKLTDAFNEAKKLGVVFTWDRDNCGYLKAFNANEVEQYGYDCRKISCGSVVSYGDVKFADTCISFYDYCGCDNGDELEMKATPRQLKQWKKEHPSE